MLGVVTARGRSMWGVLVLGVAGGAKLTTTPMTDLTGLVCIHWSERTHAKCRRRAVVSTSVVAIGVCG